MNEIIKGLYEIEEQAGKIMESANARRQKLLEEKRRKIEDSAAEMEKELEGRLAILRSQLEEQTEEEMAAYRGFGRVLSQIVNMSSDLFISETECRAFADVLELSGVTSR